MQLDEILTPGLCQAKLTGVSKKRVLTNVSELVAQQNELLKADEIFNALWQESN